MLSLPIHKRVRFLLVSPHYPENLGASCRAIKTMGFTSLGVVRPSRLALPTHPMAAKMAVKSQDVLDQVEEFDNLSEATVGFELVVGTTARRGVSWILPPAKLAPKLVELTAQGKNVCIVFGNEKSGLTSEELDLCDFLLRVPLAADQPSLNLAQAVQIVAYELFQCALLARDSAATSLGPTVFANQGQPPRDEEGGES